MNTTQFKTTIKCANCVAKATPVLDELIGKDQWQVDFKNPSKILTVTANKNADEIIQAVEKAGYKAEPLS